MKLLLIVSFCFLQLSISATEQEPDYLIINNDTLYLASFPLSDLNFATLPFGKFAPNTACWRGYNAVWIVENDSLFLKELIPCDYDTLSSDFSLVQYFLLNGYQPKIIDGKIFADWYSGKIKGYLVYPNIYYYRHNDADYFETRLQFENGLLILNRLNTRH